MNWYKTYSFKNLSVASSVEDVFNAASPRRKMKIPPDVPKDYDSMTEYIRKLDNKIKFQCQSYVEFLCEKVNELIRTKWKVFKELDPLIFYRNLGSEPPKGSFIEISKTYYYLAEYEYFNTYVAPVYYEVFNPKITNNEGDSENEGVIRRVAVFSIYAFLDRSIKCEVVITDRDFTPIQKTYDLREPTRIADNLSASWYRLATSNENSESLNELFLSKFSPPSLRGLASEALKCDSFQEFKDSFLSEIKHGTYWHVTQDPNFRIDAEKGPRDMSSMGNQSITKGSLMITSDLEYWVAFYTNRAYAALIDMSSVDKSAYRQVQRGFGNEFSVQDPSKARVVKVFPIKDALRYDRRIHGKMPGSYEDLENFYNKVKSEFEIFIKSLEK